MIELQNVAKTYQISKENIVNAVRGVTTTIDPGEFVVITGRSGSGKTTLLNLAAGLTKPTSGKVILDGVDLWGLSDSRQSALRGKSLGFIFQFPSLLPALTTLDNVRLPVTIRSAEGARDKGDEKEAEETARTRSMRAVPSRNSLNDGTVSTCKPVAAASSIGRRRS